MSISVDNKTRFLEINYSTACNRLRKSIMFELIKETGKDICYRCGNKINNVSELSIDHKKSWLYVDIKLFWSLDNITFSHSKCNTVDRPRGMGKKCGLGLYWCNGCKQCLSIKNFGKYNKA
ncbi:MAG: HNH endonuclease, partial [Candidatus Neomarinimicrobiota bacterium]